MTLFTGRWTARVEQDFEIEADTHEEFLKLLAQEMSPRNVVELLDFEHTEDYDEDKVDPL